MSSELTTYETSAFSGQRSFNGADHRSWPAGVPNAFGGGRSFGWFGSVLAVTASDHLRWLTSWKGVLLLASLTTASAFAAMAAPLVRLWPVVAAAVLLALVVGWLASALQLLFTIRRAVRPVGVSHLDPSGTRLSQVDFDALSSALIEFASRDVDSPQVIKEIELLVPRAQVARNQLKEIDRLPLVRQVLEREAGALDFDANLRSRCAAITYLSKCAAAAERPNTFNEEALSELHRAAVDSAGGWMPPQHWVERFDWAVRTGASRINNAILERQHAAQADHLNAQTNARAQGEAMRQQRLKEEEARAREVEAKTSAAFSLFKRQLQTEVEPVRERRDLLQQIQVTVTSLSSQTSWSGVNSRLGKAIAAADRIITDGERFLLDASRKVTPAAVEALASSALASVRSGHVDFFLFMAQLWGSNAAKRRFEVDSPSKNVAALGFFRYLDELGQKNESWSHLWRSFDKRGYLWLHASDLRGNPMRASQSFTVRVEVQELPGSNQAQFSILLFVPHGIQGDETPYSVEEREGYSRGRSSIVESFKPRIHESKSRTATLVKSLTLLESKLDEFTETAKKWREDKVIYSERDVRDSYSSWARSFKQSMTDRWQRPTKETPGYTWEDANTFENTTTSGGGTRREESQAFENTLGQMEEEAKQKTSAFKAEVKRAKEEEDRAVREVSYEVTWKSINIDLNDRGTVLEQWMAASGKDTDNWLAGHVEFLLDSSSVARGLLDYIKEHRAELESAVGSTDEAYRSSLQQVALDESRFASDLRHFANIDGKPMPHSNRRAGPDAEDLFSTMGRGGDRG